MHVPNPHLWVNGKRVLNHDLSDCVFRNQFSAPKLAPGGLGARVQEAAISRSHAALASSSICCRAGSASNHAMVHNMPSRYRVMVVKSGTKRLILVLSNTAECDLSPSNVPVSSGRQAAMKSEAICHQPGRRNARRLRRELINLIPRQDLVGGNLKSLVGLLGQPAAIGNAFQITSDEVLTWNQIYQFTAEAAGVAAPRLVHIASDFITACLPEDTGTLLGDKSHCALFDNTKIKRFVPDFLCTTRYRKGIARTIAWFDADPAQQQIDEEANAAWDRLITAYERGLEAARREFGR